METNNISTKKFIVFENDDYGRPTKYMGIFIASSVKEARELASKHYNDNEIINTGFYNAKEITDEEIKKETEELQKLIQSKTKVLNGTDENEIIISLNEEEARITKKILNREMDDYNISISELQYKKLDFYAALKQRKLDIIQTTINKINQSFKTII